jgi:hypothetical protein
MGETFDTIEELRAALVKFATRYNETWLVARHRYRTPSDVCRPSQRKLATCARIIRSCTTKLVYNALRVQAQGIGGRS